MLDQTLLPKPSATFRKRFFVLLAMILMCMAVTFVYFILHYSQPLVSNKTSDKNSSINSFTASQSIHDIQQRALLSEALTPSVDHSPHPPPLRPTLTPTAPDHSHQVRATIFKAASQSPLSVYHSAAALVSRNPNNQHPHQTLSYNSTLKKTSDLYQHAHVDSLDDHSSHRIRQDTTYALSAGTIIPATLVTGINSDLPGHILARVRRNTYDTTTGDHLLIPQGSMLFGKYDSSLVYGQSRVLIVWNKLIFPDGLAINLNALPGTDLEGYAGLSDRVNHHYWRIFGTSFMLSIFSSAGQLSQPQNNSNQLTTQQLIYGAIGQQMSQTAMQLVAKNMNIQPTIEIRPGDNFNVLLTHALQLPTAIL